MRKILSIFLIFLSLLTVNLYGDEVPNLDADLEVDAIHFSILNTPSDLSQNQLESYISRFNSLILIQRGDVFSSARLSDGTREIQSFLLKRGRVGFKIFSKKFFLKSTHKIRLEIEIHMGDSVQFQFRGNQFFSEWDLNQLLDEQKQLGLGKDYAESIRDRILKKYHSVGFVHASVEVISSQYSNQNRAITGFDRSISYLIQEGPRVKIRNIEFTGTAGSFSPDLRDIFYKKASRSVQNRTFILKDVEDASQRVVSFLKENGYLTAQLNHVHTVFPGLPRNQKEGSVVDLIIDLEEGDQTFLEEVEITGNTVFSQKEIEKILKLKKGQPLFLMDFEAGLETLKKRYKEKGYLDFHILNEANKTQEHLKPSVVTYSVDYRFARIQLILSEGRFFYLGKIKIIGLEKTHEEILWKELSFLKKGMVLDYSILLKVEEQLKRLGIFSEVHVTIKKDSDLLDHQNMQIAVKETDRGMITGGPGFRTDLGMRIFGQLSYINLWGKNHTGIFSLNANRRLSFLSGGVYPYKFLEGQAQLDYVWPYFLDQPLIFRPSLSVGRVQYLNFSADSISISTLWEKVLLNQPKLTTSMSYTFESIHQFDAYLSIDNQFLRIGSLIPRLTLDARDHPLLPTSGFYFTSWMDLSNPVLGSQVSPKLYYYRVQLRGDLHVPLGMNFGFYSSFRTGYEKTVSGFLPLIKQFSLGGVGSLRGYHEQELNLSLVAPSLTIFSGGLSYLNYRSEITLPVSDSLRFALFLDVANLLVNDYGIKDLYYGSGGGMRYQTPVGTINFDVGIKLNPTPGTDLVVLHFSLGRV